VHILTFLRCSMGMKVKNVFIPLTFLLLNHISTISNFQMHVAMLVNLILLLLDLLKYFCGCSPMWYSFPDLIQYMNMPLTNQPLLKCIRRSTFILRLAHYDNVFIYCTQIPSALNTNIGILVHSIKILIWAVRPSKSN